MASGWPPGGGAAGGGDRGAAPRAVHGALPVGTVLSHTHRIDALVAVGGMGEIYRATNLTNGDIVAIKTLRPQLADDPKLRELFRREGSVLRKLRDPAIVFYEGTLFSETGLLYLVMEFVDGPSLADVARGAPLSVDQVRRLRDRLARGLAAAHEQGVIHRDLSPENVLLPGGRLEDAKLIDFGIAKQQAQPQTTLIGRDFAGKLAYAAPEQFGLFGGHVDARSDFYSLGLVLAYAAIGRALEACDSLADAIAVRQRVPDLAALPPALRDEIAQLLQPDPADRPRSMSAVLAVAAPPPRPEPPRPPPQDAPRPAVAAPSAEPPAAEAPGTPASRPPPRRPLRGVVQALGALLAFALVAVYAAQRGPVLLFLTPAGQWLVGGGGVVITVTAIVIARLLMGRRSK